MLIDKNIYDTPRKLEDLALIGRARSEGKWLYCFYLNLCYSPDEMIQEHKEKSFPWGINWQLTDPVELLTEMNVKIDKLKSKRDNLATRIEKHKIMQQMIDRWVDDK